MAMEIARLQVFMPRQARLTVGRATLSARLSVTKLANMTF